MAAAFTLNVDTEKLDAIRSALGDIKNGYPKVMSAAINKTLSTVQTQAVARIGNDLNLPASRIKQDFSVSKATQAKVEGYVKATGKPVGLISFASGISSRITAGVTQDVKVKVKRSSPYVTVKHAFAAYAKNSLNLYWRQYAGARSVWRPKTAYNRMPAIYRLPLQRLTGPRIEDIYAGSTVFDPVTIQAQALFLSRLDDQVAELFRRMSAGY